MPGFAPSASSRPRLDSAPRITHTDGMSTRPVAIEAAAAEARRRQSVYPEPFASRTAGRLKRPLGAPFGLTNFGVNLTRLAPGACSALRHAHSRQDEFIYVLEGEPTLITDADRKSVV